MAVLAKLLNAVPTGLVNNDSDISVMLRALMPNGGTFDISNGSLLVTTNSVAIGTCFVPVTRTSSGEKFLVVVRNNSAATINTSGTKKVWIAVSQARIDDPTLNTDPTGAGIASIVTGASYPASNFIPLASITGGVITDDRTLVGNGFTRSGFATALRGGLLFVDSAGNETVIDTDGTAGQILYQGGNNVAPFFGNVPTVEADGETISAVAGETITAGEGIGAVFLGTGNLDTFFIAQTTGETDLAIGDADARTRIAFSITPDATEKVNALRYVEFQLKKVGNPTDVLEMRLLDSTKAVVSGWTTASFSGASLSTSYITYRVTQNAVLTNGAKYYVEFRRQTANDAVNYYHLLVHSADVNTGYGTATYTGTTTTWTADSVNDAVYTIQYGFNTTAGLVYDCDSRYLSTCYCDGVAITSGLAGATVKLRSDGLVSATGILSGYAYYLNSIRQGTFIGGQQITSSAALAGASSQNSSSNNLSNIGVYESFTTPAVAVDITSVNLKADYSLTLDGAYPAFTGGSITLKIYQDNGSNSPGTLIATGTTGAFSGTGSNATISIPITAGLAPSTKYWLEANASCMSPTPAITNTITFRGATTNVSTYSDYATRNPQNSGTFTIDSAKDLYFDLVFAGTNTSLNNTDKTYNYKSMNGAYSTTPAQLQYLLGKGVTSTKLNLLTKSSNAKTLGTEIFGDGSDGDVTIAGTVTLTRDMYYRNLTIPAGTTLDPAGYSVYVQGVVSGSGTINRNGNAGGNATVNGGTGAPQVGGVPGAVLNQGTLNAERLAGGGGF